MVQCEQALQEFGIVERGGPAVGGEDGLIQLAVRVNKPGRAGVVEIRKSAFLQFLDNVRFLVLCLAKIPICREIRQIDCSPPLSLYV